MTEIPPIVHFLYEPGDGGLDRVAIYLANGMAERGIPTELWLTKTTGPLFERISPQVKIRKIPSLSFGNRGFRLVVQIPILAAMIRKHRPRAIFSAGNQSNLSLALARKLAGNVATKIIQKITNPIFRPNSGKYSRWHRKHRFELTARLGDICLTLSPADARNYQRLMPKAAGKLYPVINAYICQDILQIASSISQRKTSEIPQLLAVGRISVQKDYETMVRALAMIKDRPWYLTILGDGPLRKQTEALVHDLGLAEKIIFKGFVKKPADYYAQSDLLILSSKWEGFAAVPIEAMAANCAVVTTDSSDGLTELLQQAGQSATPIGNATKLSQSIIHALENPQQCAQQQKIAINYTVENSIDDHIRLLTISEQQA
ncbi:hypothetical protein MNBD_ALPHA04-1190 [hydrothermal vent metagenome]|uniref:Uncharacterized protein n=1 Tax=hydrothermal vent metagenome TaxID=652676 RepID=A0A3B0RTD2_9ZZZZ